MAMFMTYRGIFGSRENNKWEAVILCERDSAPAEIGALSFTGDEPLVIEWPERTKDEPICGSTATLNLLSPGDRTYIDLYSIEVGRVRLDVYRNDVLYWSGMLDPEFYEEPYSMMKDYEVTLTFSDFGILERLKYNLAGFKTLRELVDYAIGRTGIMFTRIDEQYISTMFADGNSPLQLSELSVRSDNFYDEDGEALSLRDVLDGFMRPLGLKMIQRGGVVWIFDLNGLRTAAASSKVEWMGEDQMLGVDKVYNNVRITWSPYVQKDKLLPEDCWTEPVDPNKVNPNNRNPYPEELNLPPNMQLLSYHYSYDRDRIIEGTNVGFSLWLSSIGKNDNVVINNTAAKYYKIVPNIDGEESEGIALIWPAFESYYEVVHEEFPRVRDYLIFGCACSLYGLNIQSLKSQSTMGGCGDKIFTSRKAWLPPISGTGSSKLRLRVTLPMLMDCRFNPFESAKNLEAINMSEIFYLYEHFKPFEELVYIYNHYRSLNHEDSINEWNAKGNLIYVPVTIKYQPDGSDDIYVWTNRSIINRGSDNNPANLSEINQTLGVWRLYNQLQDAAPAQDQFGWLCYCDKDRDGEKSGVLGWKNNRQALTTKTGNDIPTIIRTMPDGQYIPYPVIKGYTGGGQIWMEVRSGKWIISDGTDGTELLDDSIYDTGLWNDKHLSFILFKLPQLEVVRAAMFDMDLDDEDVEYAATLNSAAKEDLEIETVCGSREGGYPMARGAYFLSSDYSQVTRLKRAGRTASIEQLLIGTLFSQYAKRHTKLTGTTELPGNTLLLYREAMQPQDTRFLLTAAVEDCGEDLCESTVVELSPDEYDKA